MADFQIRRPGQRVAISGGGAGGSNRPAGAPVPVSGRPNNAVFFFEDFIACPIARPDWAVGTTAAPGTTTHVAENGQPGWAATTLGTANASTVGCSSTAAAPGLLRIDTGAASGDGMVVETLGRSTTTAVQFNATPTQPANVLFRVAYASSLADRIDAFGIVTNTLAAGTDIVTDPDTTIGAASINAILITRNSAAYSGDGAGEVVARLYEATGTDNASLLLQASVTVNTNYKYEIAFTGTGLNFYVNNALIGSIATPSISSWAGRPMIGVVSQAAASKVQQTDYYYQELSLLAAR